MKKILLTLLLLCGLQIAVPAQDMRTLFMSAPDAVLPLLPASLRADCVDFAEAGMSYPVTNALGGKSTLKVLKDDYLFLQSSGISTVAMKVLPYGDSFVVCVVNTVSAEASDSRIAFYDSGWKKLDAGSFFTAPSIRDFFNSPDEKLLDICDIYLVSLDLSATENTLVAEYTMPDYMNSDDAEKVRALLSRIVYRWNGSAFVRE
jgi:hypothetical protein